jgi:acyl-coenzyme A thioesterase PaaI-like protein
MTMYDPAERMRQLAEGAWSDLAHPARRAGDELRRLVRYVLAGNLDDAALGELAVQLAAIGGEAPTGSRYGLGHGMSPADVANLRPNLNGTHPLAGPVNAIAPPIRIQPAGERALGDVTYDARFEGMPGLVQGGFIAAGFDLMLGQAVLLSGTGGPTGTLTVRYRAPTPLDSPLRYETWTERIEGRRIHVSGTLTDLATGIVTAEAEGIFISPRR